MRVIKLSPQDDEMPTRDAVLAFFRRKLLTKSRAGRFGLSAGKSGMKDFGPGTLLLFTYEKECMFMGRAQSGIVHEDDWSYFTLDMKSLREVSGDLRNFEAELRRRGLHDKHIVQTQAWPLLSPACDAFALKYFGYDLGPGNAASGEGARTAPIGDKAASTGDNDAWSEVELDAAVGAYGRMLAAERDGQPYSKAAINRELRGGPLAGRSRGSVEFRMANISSVLRENDLPWVQGYQPRKNVGLAVAEIILRSLQKHGIMPAGFAGKGSVEAEQGARSASVLSRPLGVDEQAPNDDPAERQLLALRIRRGQTKFRENLLALYGGKCTVTGTAVEAVLEACHVARHSSTGNNHTDNGILLRADVHALFDEGLIRIDPHTMTLEVDRSLEDSEYYQYNGRALSPRTDGSAISREYIAYSADVSPK